MELAGERLSEVLAGVADDAQGVGGRIEVCSEAIAVELHGELGHQVCLGSVGVNRVDSTAVADPVELSVLNTEIDSDERRVVTTQSVHRPDVFRARRIALPEPN